jgi:hypothetical protein
MIAAARAEFAVHPANPGLRITFRAVQKDAGYKRMDSSLLCRAHVFGFFEPMPSVKRRKPVALEQWVRSFSSCSPTTLTMHYQAST